MEALKKFPLTVLYVEDEEEIRNKIAQILERRFETVLLGQNGVDGLDIYMRNKPDIILADIRMPKMNGLEMSTKIRNIDMNIPIIIVTAYNTPELLLQAIEIGVDQFIIKPVNVDKLNDILEKISRNLLVQREREETNQMLLSSFEYAPMGIVILDNELKVLFTNNYLEKLLGYSKSYISRHNITEFIIENERERFKSTIFGKEKDNFKIVVNIEKSDANHIEIEIYISKIIHIVSGKRVMVGFIQELTETRLKEKRQKRLMFQLKKLYKELDEFSDLLDENERDERHIDLAKYDITEKEKSIIFMIINGSPNKEIGEHIHISEGTVKKHVNIIYKKLGIRNRMELVSFLKDSIIL